jgi:hypothetical protein
MTARPDTPSHVPPGHAYEALPAHIVRRRRIQLVLLALLFLGPLLVAAAMYFGGFGQPDGRVNRGELIVPPRPVPMAALPSPAGTTEPHFLRGRWSLVHVADGPCTGACAAALAELRTIRLALDRDAPRIQRVLLVDAAEFGPAVAEHADGSFVAASIAGAEGAAVRETFGLGGTPAAGSGRLYVVDPNGNLMMSYAPPIEQRDVVKDLEKLLKLSKIG